MKRIGQTLEELRRVEQTLTDINTANNRELSKIGQDIVTGLSKDADASTRTALAIGSLSQTLAKMESEVAAINALLPALAPVKGQATEPKIAPGP